MFNSQIAELHSFVKGNIYAFLSYEYVYACCLYDNLQIRNNDPRFRNNLINSFLPMFRYCIVDKLTECIWYYTFLQQNRATLPYVYLKDIHFVSFV